MGNHTFKIEETNISKAEFIRKAMGCDYNHLWVCQHPDQKGKNCSKICEKYQNPYDHEEQGKLL